MTPLSKERERLFRRLHSAAGILPLGAFFLAHVWINARALQGEGAYDAAAARLEAFPAMLAIEALFVWVPLAFHAGYGVRLLVTEKARQSRGPLDKPWGAKLQRVTGALTLLFLAFHLFQFRLPVALGRAAPEDLFPLLCDQLSATTSAGIPVNAALYLAGLAGTSYHLANGVLGFCHTFGLSGGGRAYWISACCTGLGLAAFAVGANTVIYFATGAAWPGEGAPPPPPDGVGIIRTSAGTPE